MPLPFPRTDWRTQAVCRDVDGEIFFPVGDPTDPADPRNAEALACCAACPVREPCLAEALVRIPDGIAAGLTAGQRRALSRHRRRPATPRGPVRSPLAPDPGMTPSQAHTRIRGVELLIEGTLSRREIARRLDVDTRTVERWAARPEVRAALPEPPITNVLSRREARQCGARAV